jgi:acetyl-CoA carboxylase biotin carboxyl carrier protein
MTKDIPITPEDIEEIVTILDKTPYDRLDVRIGRFTLKVARTGKGWSQELELADVAGTVPALDPAAVSTEPKVAADDRTLAIRAPLPGTFYRAPQPGAPPFVEAGDRVGPDTVVAIIETMKLMTSVSAGCSGIVEEIVIPNATLVDTEAVLMRVRPDAT